MKRWLYLLTWIALLSAGVTLAQDTSEETPTLLLYSTVERMLSGDMANAIDPETVQADLSAFPPTWTVLGVGTTNQPMRNGELMPDGTAADVDFWWADPSSESEADIVDIAPDPDSTALPDETVDPDPEFPFLGLAIGDPDTALVFTAEDVENIHVWLRELMETEGIELAGITLDGEFGPVNTTVAYNIPLTGLDLSGGYVGDETFRFGEYEPAVWHMNGLYAADPELQPVISTPGNPIHLHGYQLDSRLGGHIASAQAENVIVVVYPLETVQQELNDE
jgi:hypothetical protein